MDANKVILYAEQIQIVKSPTALYTLPKPATISDGMGLTYESNIRLQGLWLKRKGANMEYGQGESSCNYEQQ